MADSEERGKARPVAAMLGFVGEPVHFGRTFPSKQALLDRYRDEGVIEVTGGASGEGIESGRGVER